METEIGVRMRPSVISNFWKPRRRNHHAAGVHEARFECLDSGRVDGMGHAEIIGMDDEQLGIGREAKSCVQSGCLGLSKKKGWDEGCQQKRRCRFHSGLASYTDFPPTKVCSTLMERISFGEIAVMSLSMAVKSASLPGWIDPFAFSANSAYAASVV